MKTIINSNNTTTISTEAGSYTVPSKLWELFASCSEPTPLVGLVAQAQAMGFSNGYTRACVQALAQPGQYSGSACIGAIVTSTQGKRLFVQVSKEGELAAARPKLTRKGSNTPAAAALAAENA